MKENRHNYVNNMKLSFREGWGRDCFFAGLAHYTLCCKGPDEVIKRSIVPRLSVVISYTFTI